MTQHKRQVPKVVEETEASANEDLLSVPLVRAILLRTCARKD